jgi:hypothetical protein
MFWRYAIANAGRYSSEIKRAGAVQHIKPHL